MTDSLKIGLTHKADTEPLLAFFNTEKIIGACDQLQGIVQGINDYFVLGGLVIQTVLIKCQQ